jgi:flagellin FlaB
MKTDSAFTGLEAAIVLIAFVVVAAVFSYVILGAGFFTTQKSQETIYRGVEQATTNIQVVGNVYGITPGADQDIQQVQFTLGLAPGSPSIDLEKMMIVYSTQTVMPTTYTSGTSTSEFQKFVATDASGTQVTVMKAQQQVQIRFNVTTLIPENTQFTVEIRPATGASLPFTKTTPATLQVVNVLN